MASERADASEYEIVLTTARGIDANISVAISTVADPLTRPGTSTTAIAAVASALTRSVRARVTEPDDRQADRDVGDRGHRERQPDPRRWTGHRAAGRRRSAVG